MKREDGRYIFPRPILILFHSMLRCNAASRYGRFRVQNIRICNPHAYSLVERPIYFSVTLKI
jgi:hypothetical protein